MLRHREDQTARPGPGPGPRPGAAPAPGRPIAPGDWDAGALSLLAADFQGIYQVYVAAASERVTMLKYTLSLLAAPFAATVALVSADVVVPGALASWSRVPVYVFVLLTAFGVLAALPYLRMMEASITHARTARALNNFRLLYTLQLREEFASIGWSPNLPVDPAFPERLSPLSWAGVTAALLAVLDAGYITGGLIGIARLSPGLAVVSVCSVAAVLLLIAYVARADVFHRDIRPENPFDFPRVEI